MHKGVKLRDIRPGNFYWVKTDGRWRICQYVLHDYSDGTTSYFFDAKNSMRIFGVDKIERVVEICEPADVNPVPESV